MRARVAGEDAPVSERRDASRSVGRLGAVLQNTGWLLGGKAVGAILSLVYLGLATRTLGPADFGSFAVILGAAQAVVGLVTFQTWQIVVRYGVEHLRDARVDRLHRLQALCLKLDVASAIVGLGLSAGLISLFAGQFGWTAELKREAMIFCATLLVCINSTPFGILRLHDRFDIAALAETVIPVMRMVGALVAVAFAPTIVGFLAAWAAAEVAAAAFTWIAAIRVGGFSLGAGRGVIAENPGIRRFATLTNAASSLSAISRQVPILIVGWLAGAAAAGGYRLAFQLSQALTKLSGTLSRAVFPELMRTRARSTLENVAGLFRKTTVFAAVAGLAVMATIAAFGEFALRLVGGEHYVSAYPLLLILGAAAVVDLAGVSFEPALFAAGRPGRAFLLRLVGIAFLLALPFALVPRFGPEGAAVAALIAAIITFALLGAAAWRALKFGRAPKPAGAPQPDPIDTDD